MENDKRLRVVFSVARARNNATPLVQKLTGKFGEHPKYEFSSYYLYFWLISFLRTHVQFYSSHLIMSYPFLFFWTNRNFEASIVQKEKDWARGSLVANALKKRAPTDLVFVLPPSPVTIDRVVFDRCRRLVRQGKRVYFAVEVGYASDLQSLDTMEEEEENEEEGGVIQTR